MIATQPDIDTGTPELLDAMPLAAVNLATVPAAVQRRLFEAILRSWQPTVGMYCWPRWAQLATKIAEWVPAPAFGPRNPRRKTV